MKKHKAEQLTLGNFPVIDLPAIADPDAKEKAMDALTTTQDLGIKVIQATAKVNDAYFKLCCHLRENNAVVGMEAHRKVLYDLGYNKSRVSEIIRVSQAPDAVWSEYNARLIGFNKALDAVRGKQATPAGMLMLNSEDLTEARLAETETADKPETDAQTEATEEAEEPGTEETDNDETEPAESDEIKFTRLVADLAILARKVVKTPRSIVLNSVQIDISVLAK